MCEYDLSIVIPVYNNENEICETVKTLIKKSGVKHEIIFVNDGSADNSQKVLEKIKEGNPQLSITIWTQENQGVSVARNQGIELAKGKYILFCDADDQLTDSFLDKISRKLKKGYDFVCWQHNIKRNGEIQHLNYKRVDCNCEGRVLNKDTFLSYVMQDKFRLCMGTFAIRKELLLENNIFYTPGWSYGEDLEFILKAIIHSTCVCCIPEELYTYVRRDTSAMGKFTLKRFDAPAMVLCLQRYIEDKDIQIAKCNKEYLRTVFFAKQFVYSMEFCLQYLGIREYRMFWRYLNENYSCLLREAKKVLRTVPREEIGRTNKRIRFMKWNVYLYSWCIMFKNSLRRKIQ